MARVLVIDDDVLFAQLLVSLLGRLGYDARHAADAETGLRMLGVGDIEAVLLDLEMPVVDGAECLRRIRGRAETAAMPVIMVSATPHREIVLRLAALGVQGIIIKNAQLIKELPRKLAAVLDEAAATNVASKKAAPVAPPASSGRAGVPSAAPASGAAPQSAPQGADAAPEPAGEPGLAFNPEDIPEHLSADLALEQLRALKPVLSRTELQERVTEGVDLRPLAPAARQVLALTGSATCSLDAVAKAIKQDQALSLKVLKLANSSVYSRGERVDSVHKAVGRIGLAQIRSSVLCMGVIEQFSGAGFGTHIRGDRFWEHSLACGLIASLISDARGEPRERADAMFTAGLLHDVGRIIFAERLEELYGGVIDTAERLELPLELVESRLLLSNHADVTDRLLRRWNFPKDLIDPIVFHHLSVGNIRRQTPRMLADVATLALANRLAHALLLGSSGNDVLYPFEEFVHTLNLRTETVASIMDAAPAQTLDLKLCMMSHSTGAPSPDFVEEVRGLLPEAARPLFVAGEPALDPARAMLSRVLSPAGDAPPNFAVVRITSVREREAMVAALQRAEAAAGVEKLPVLVCASGNSCFLHEAAIGSRRVQQIVLPVSVSRFARAIAELLGASAAAEPRPAIAA